jgi:hypothetical protein
VCSRAVKGCDRERERERERERTLLKSVIIIIQNLSFNAKSALKAFLHRALKNIEHFLFFLYIILEYKT